MSVPKLRFKADDGSEFPEWVEKSLGDVMASMEYGLNTAAMKFDGARKYLRITDIDDETHRYLITDIVSPSGELDEKYLARTGDLFFARTGASVGKTYLYDNRDGILYFAGFLIRGRIKPEYNPYYIFVQTLTSQYSRWVKVMSARSGQPGINANEYASYKFLCATDKNEQQKIADLISSLDNIIKQTMSELVTWERQKRGVMQLLFSQKVRFKEDDGSEFPEWEEKTLSELGEFFKGAPLSKADISEDGIPLILYGELYTTYNEIANKIIRCTRTFVDKKYLSHTGDVVIPTSGETPEEISTATCVMLDGVALAGDLNIYRTSEEIDGRIMSYLLNHQINNDIARIAQGKSIVHVNASELRKLSVYYPKDFTEQQKIAACLSAFDDVIDKTKKELDAYRELKKGLLQQMLV